MSNPSVGGFSDEAMRQALGLAWEEECGGIDFAYAEKLKKKRFTNKQGCEGCDDEVEDEDDDDEYSELINDMVRDGYTDAEAIRMIHILEDQGLQTHIKK